MIRNFDGGAYARFLFLLTVCACFFFASGERAQAATLIKPANTLGLLGWWRFDDGSGNVALDSSGNNNTGSLYEMDETDWTTGVFGTALQFDNSVMAEHVVVSHSSSLSPTAAVTVLGWAKPITYGSGGAATFVEKAYGTSYILYLESSLQGLIFNVNGADCLSNSTIITLSTWQHIAATYDGTTVRFYVNGTEQGTCNSVGSVGTDTSDVKIGNDDTLTTAFDGYLDDVRVYSRALSRNEILQIMRGDRIAKASVTPEVTGTLATNLTGWWTFDGREVNWATGRVTDKSGQGNTGAMIGLATTSTPTDGPLGQAFLFDGVSGYVSGTQSGFLMGTSPRSIVGWFRLNSDTANPKVPFAYGTCGAGQDGNTFGVYVNASEVLNFWGCGSSDFSTGISVSVDRWYHVAAVYDGSTVRVYVDGSLAGSPTSRTLGTGSSGWFVGSDGSIDPANYAFPGNVDDVRVYNRALSASEVFKIYTTGNVTQNVSFSGGNNLESGLIGWWTMDGPDVNWGTGKVSDRSGSGNDGYVVSMSTTTSVESGKIGQALLFDSVDDLVRTGSDFVGTNPLTISLWMNARSFGEGSNARLVTNHNVTGFFFRVSVTNSALQFSSNGGANTAVSANNAVVFNKWTHVVVTRDASGTANIYVDGVLSGSADQNSGTPQVGSTNVVIGNHNGGVVTFDGTIDDVRIYNRVLSVSEVRQLYDGRR